MDGEQSWSDDQRGHCRLLKGDGSAEGVPGSIIILKWCSSRVGDLDADRSAQSVSVHDYCRCHLHVAYQRGATRILVPLDARLGQGPNAATTRPERRRVTTVMRGGDPRLEQCSRALGTVVDPIRSRECGGTNSVVRHRRAIHLLLSSDAERRVRYRVCRWSVAAQAWVLCGGVTQMGNNADGEEKIWTAAGRGA